MLSEQERAAYIAGDVRTADLLAQVEQWARENEELEKKLEDAEETSLEQWEQDNGPAGKYRDFFYACFERLGEHYPAPDVDNEHDCQVIFDAIARGELK